MHAERLKRLSQEAEAAEQAQDDSTAVARWRDALELLPAASRQYSTISNRIEQLNHRTEHPTSLTPSSALSQDSVSDAGRKWKRGLGVAGVVALLVWKFKFVVVFLLTKAKLLLAGLTKLTTLTTMAASLGVYWTQWGWKFALGLVASIYVHEMGHVAALRRYGIRASAPMFIPGLGAVVRLKQAPLNAREDARVGLAGPIWGACAALACLGIGTIMRWPAWIAIAHVGAWINLFNLLPIWQLDGSRGFRALDRDVRIVLLLLIAVTWVHTREGLLVLILLVGGLRLLTDRDTSELDYLTAAQFTLLIIVLATLCAYTPRMF